MSIFTLVKAAVTTRQAADFYGLQVNRNGMTCCPFHPDRHPSMKVDKRYYCFGCHETGDVIDFVGKLFRLSPYEAARKLASDFGLDPDSPSAPAVFDPEQAIEFDTKQWKKERHCACVLIDYECALKERMHRFAPQSPDGEWDQRYADACHSLPQIGGLIESLYSPDALEREETEHSLSEDGTLARIEAWLTNQHHNKEMNNDAQDTAAAA